MQNEIKPDFKNHYSNHTELHTPLISVKFAESTEMYSALQCNSDLILYTNMPEVTHLLKPLSEIGKPNVVLELGGGLGRCSVYLNKLFNWDTTKFIMLDGNSGSEQYCPIGGDDGEFYNSLRVTKTFCVDNGISESRLQLIDAANYTWSEEITDTVDIVYSFLAVGFHWDVNMYLDKLLPLLSEDALLIFGIRGHDRGLEFTTNQIAQINARGDYKIKNLIIDSELNRTSLLILEINHDK